MLQPQLQIKPKLLCISFFTKKIDVINVYFNIKNKLYID
jgi:hypothetical protein